MRSVVLKICIAVVCLFGLSCANHKNYQAGQLHGRWVSPKDDSFVLFSPGGLCLEASRTPLEVTVYEYRFNGQSLELTTMSSDRQFRSKPDPAKQPGYRQSWTVESLGDELQLAVGAEIRKFRASSPLKPSSQLQALVGTWVRRRPDGHTDLFEFLPWGERIAVPWWPIEASRPKGEVFPAAEWHACRYDGRLLEVDGISGRAGRSRYALELELAGDRFIAKAAKGRGIPVELMTFKRRSVPAQGSDGK